MTAEGDFEQIKKTFIDSLPGVLDQMSSLIQGLNSNIAQDKFSELRNHIHKLAGTAGTFGFNEATNLCKEWDAKLSPIIKEFSNEKVQPLLSELEGFLSQLKKHFNL